MEDITKTGTDGLKGIRLADLYAQQKAELQARHNQLRSGDIGYHALAYPDLFAPVENHNLGDFGSSRFDNPIWNATRDDVQNQRANLQSEWEKIGLGVLKGAELALSTAARGWGGFVYGLLSGSLKIATGQGAKGFVQGLWDNELTQVFNEFDKMAEEFMPNYYTTNEQMPGFFNKSIGNILGDMVIKNAGFLVGAVYGGSLFTKTLGAIIPALTKASKAASWANAFLGTAASTIGEAGVEAHHTSDDFFNFKRQQIYDDYDRRAAAIEQQYGKNTPEVMQKLAELNGQFQDIMEKARSEAIATGNMDFLMNVAILAPSNLWQFGRTFARANKGYLGPPLRFLGDETEGTMRSGTKEMSKLWLGKNAVIEGMEEVKQKHASLWSGSYAENELDNYIAHKYDPDATEKVNNFINVGFNTFSDLIKDPGTYEEFSIGALMGGIGAVTFGVIGTKEDGSNKWGFKWEGGIRETIKARREAIERETRIAESMNSRYAKSKKLQINYQNAVSHTAWDHDMELSAAINDEFSFKNAAFGQMASDLAMHAAAGKLEDLKAQVSNAYTTDDRNLASIISETSSVDKDGNIQGPFAEFATLDERGQVVPNFGNEESKQKMIEQVKNEKETILKEIDRYDKIRRKINQHTGGRLTEDQLAELTWMYAQTENWKERREESLKTARTGIQLLRDSYKERLAKLETEPETANVKKAKEALTASISGFEELLAEDDKVLAARLASDHRVLSTIREFSTEKNMISIKEALAESELADKNEFIKNIENIEKLGQAIANFNIAFDRYMRSPEEQQRHQNSVREKQAKKMKKRKANKVKNALAEAKTDEEIGEILDKNDLSVNDVNSVYDEDENVPDNVKQYVESTNEDTLVNGKINTAIDPETGRTMDAKTKNYVKTLYERMKKRARANGRKIDESDFDATYSTPGAKGEEEDPLYYDSVTDMVNGGPVKENYKARYILAQILDDVRKDTNFKNKYANIYTTPQPAATPAPVTNASETVAVPPVNGPHPRVDTFPAGKSEEDLQESNKNVTVTQQDNGHIIFRYPMHALNGLRVGITAEEWASNNIEGKPEHAQSISVSEYKGQDADGNHVYTLKIEHALFGTVKIEDFKSKRPLHEIYAYRANKVNQNSTPVINTPTVVEKAVADIPIEEVKETNQEINDASVVQDTMSSQDNSTNNDNNVSKIRYYIRPTIPQYHIALMKKGIFQKFNEAVKMREQGVDFDYIYDYLERNGAFDIDNLRENDEVYFMVDPKFEEGKPDFLKGTPTIFMMTKYGQIIGSLDEKFEVMDRYFGLPKLADTIRSEYKAYVKKGGDIFVYGYNGYDTEERTAIRAALTNGVFDHYWGSGGGIHFIQLHQVGKNDNTIGILLTTDEQEALEEADKKQDTEVIKKIVEGVRDRVYKEVSENDYRSIEYSEIRQERENSGKHVYTPDDRYVYQKAHTNVSEIMQGKIPFSTEERSLNQIPGVDANSVFMYINPDGEVIFSESWVSEQDVVTRLFGENRKSGLYLLIKGAGGKYMPAAVRIKHFSKEEFDIEDVANQNTDFYKRLMSTVKKLANVDVSNKPSGEDAVKALKSVLFIPNNVHIDFKSTNDGDVIIFKKAELDDSGNEIYIEENGKRVRKETKYVVHLGNDATESLIVKRLHSLGLPIQVDMDVFDKKSYMANLISSGVLTSNLQSAQVLGSWFTVNPVDPQGKITDAEKLVAPSPASNTQTVSTTSDTINTSVQTSSVQTNPVGGADSAIIGVPVTTIDGEVYYVDLNTALYKTSIRNANGNVVNFNKLGKDKYIKIYLIAMLNNSYGNLRYGVGLYDNKCVLIDGRVFDRDTQEFLSDEEAQKIKAAINDPKSNQRYTPLAHSVVESIKKLINAKTPLTYTRNTDQGPITYKIWPSIANMPDGTVIISFTTSYTAPDGKIISKKDIGIPVALDDLLPQLFLDDGRNVVAATVDAIRSKHTNSENQLTNATVLKLEITPKNSKHNGVILVHEHSKRKELPLILKNNIFENYTAPSEVNTTWTGVTQEDYTEDHGYVFQNKQVASPVTPTTPAPATPVATPQQDAANTVSAPTASIATTIPSSEIDGIRKALKAALSDVDDFNDHLEDLSKKYNVDLSKYKDKNTPENIDNIINDIKNAHPAQPGPSAQPSAQPATQPVAQPSAQPAAQPTAQPPVQDSTPVIFNTALESKNPKDYTQYNYKYNGSKIGYYEVDGELHKNYITPVGTIDGQEIYVTVEAKMDGFLGRVTFLNTYFVFPNGATSSKINEGDEFTPDKSPINDLVDVFKYNLEGNSDALTTMLGRATPIIDSVKNVAAPVQPEVPPQAPQQTPTQAAPEQKPAAPVTDNDTNAIDFTIAKKPPLNARNLLPPHLRNPSPDPNDSAKHRLTDEHVEVWDREKELAWLEKVLPQLSAEDRLKIVKGLIKVAKNGSTAWGMFHKGMVTLSDVAAAGTTYHEAFHVVFNMLLSPKERATLLAEARKMYGKMTARELEEEMAEGFRRYVIDRQNKGFLSRIKSFFKNLFNTTSNWRKMQPHLLACYRRINSGYYANSTLKESDAERLSEEQYTTDNVGDYSTENDDIRYRETTPVSPLSALPKEVRTILINQGWTHEKFKSVSQDERDYAVECAGV